MADGWTTQLLNGLAEHLAAADIGSWRPDAGDVFEPGDTAIVIRDIPAQPDRLITLAAYPVSGMPGLADVTVGVQVRLRAGRNPSACDDLADAIYELLDGAHSLRLRGVAVVQIRRQSYTSLGADSGGRWERSENYYIDAMRPTANNTD